MREKFTEYLINRLQKVIQNPLKSITIIQITNNPSDYIRVEYHHGFNLTVKAFIKGNETAVNLTIPLRQNRPTFTEMAENIIQELETKTTWRVDDFLK